MPSKPIDDVPKKSVGEQVAAVVGSVGTLVGLPPAEPDPAVSHDSGPDETNSSNPDGHPTRKRQSDLGSG